MGLSTPEDMQKMLGDRFDKLKTLLRRTTTTTKEEACWDFYRKK